MGPRTARDFVYVDDVCHAFVRAAEVQVEPGAVFNIGSGSQTTLAELVDVARRVLGVDAEPDWGTYAARAWDTESWVSDPRRAERELGWRAETSIDEGLGLTANWMRENPEAVGRYEPETAEHERDEGDAGQPERGEVR